MARFDGVDLSTREVIERNTQRIEKLQREAFFAGIVKCEKFYGTPGLMRDDLEEWFQEWLESLENT